VDVLQWLVGFEITDLDHEGMGSVTLALDYELCLQLIVNTSADRAYHKLSIPEYLPSK
jgi:hypothetical protein